MEPSMLPPVMYRSDLDGVRLIHRGKVRDVYEYEGQLLLVATDRLSAFDVVLPDPIPGKGAALTQISNHWFDLTRDLVPNHLVETDVARFPEPLRRFPELRGRSVLAVRAEPLAIECIVRGYLAGSGWKDYRRTGEISGVRLPEGLEQAGKLPDPIFTPSTKAETGHDQNVHHEEAARIVGRDVYEQVRSTSLELYRRSASAALKRGIIVADTKFEFGLVGDRLLLIDEVLTPDSSRFWPVDGYRVGTSPPSFDKQYVRDWLERSGWDKTPPAPHLPPDIVQGTTRRYLEAYRRLTGKELRA